jgi:ABC-type Fe3+/spermidine/putrescine transport system ATPase subunit
LLGPSGCGKTTALRLIAGFERPDAGSIRIGGRDVGRLRPYERNVGLLFQHYALFPHMTVEENITYGLRHRKWPRDDIRGRVEDMLRLVKLVGFNARRPAQLSGGQQQRVALARALATSPQVILLDEPLSALDAKLRQELQVELKEILRAVGSTAIVVTHDQDEAMALAERIVVIQSGRILQDGTQEDIYSRPKCRFVAEFIGRSNWMTGRLHEGRVTIGEGLAINVGKGCVTQNRAVDVCVRPERIDLLGADAVVRDAASSDNQIGGTLAEIVHLGANRHFFVQLDSGQRFEVIKQNRANLLLTAGERVIVRFAAEDCIILPQGGAGRAP